LEPTEIFLREKQQWKIFVSLGCPLVCLSGAFQMDHVVVDQIDRVYAWSELHVETRQPPWMQRPSQLAFDGKLTGEI
jgi:hypothetical protein